MVSWYLTLFCLFILTYKIFILVTLSLSLVFSDALIIFTILDYLPVPVPSLFLFRSLTLFIPHLCPATYGAVTPQLWAQIQAQFPEKAQFI